MNLTPGPEIGASPGLAYNPYAGMFDRHEFSWLVPLRPGRHDLGRCRSRTTHRLPPEAVSGANLNRGLLSRRELPPHDGSRGARSGFLRRLPLATHQSRFGRLPAVLCPPVSRVKTIRELLILLRYREQLVPNPVAWLGLRHQVKSIGFANAPPVPWQARTRGIPFPQPHAITFLGKGACATERVSPLF